MKSRLQTLSIGEVARESGLTVEALRYYERIGLVPRAARTAGGLRRFSIDVLDRIRFIQQVQMLGLTLRQIRVLTGPGPDGSTSCRQVHALLTQHLKDIDRRVANLKQLRRTLATHLQTCERALRRTPNPKCPALNALGETR